MNVSVAVDERRVIGKKLDFRVLEKGRAKRALSAAHWQQDESCATLDADTQCMNTVQMIAIERFPRLGEQEEVSGLVQQVVVETREMK